MKSFLFLMLIASLAFASEDGCFDSSIGIRPHTPESDAITLSVVNDFTVTPLILGLDVFEGVGTPMIFGVDKVNGQIQAYNSGTGAPEGTLTLDDANAACFGIAWNNNPETDTYYTNDWSASNLFYTEDFGTSWTTESNPASTSARGFDFDGANYWSTNGNGGGVWRFLPGTGQENITTPEIPSNPSGLATFARNGGTAVAITCYQDYNIYFYQWDGSTLEYIGSAAIPVSSINRAYGLTHCDSTGHMFLSYKLDSGAYHIAELGYEITALSRSSWGSIKTSF